MSSSVFRTAATPGLTVTSSAGTATGAVVAARLSCLMSIEILANPFSLQQLEQNVLSAVK
jgi:hypothetical protein